MTADDLLKALYGVGITALGILSLALGVVLRYTPDIVRSLLERMKLISLERAGAIAAKATEESARATGWSSDMKAHEAQKLVKSIAPVAAAKADATQIADVVKAGVQAMRASIPSSDILPIPVTVVGSSIPPAPRVPRETASSP